MKITVALLVILSWSQIASSQDVKPGEERPNPDVTGIWTSGDITLQIAAKGPRLKITRTLRRREPLLILGQLQTSTVAMESVYFTDGRGETNRRTVGPAPDGTIRVQSKTHWEGKQLIVQASYSKKVAGKLVSFNSTETWETSSDGSELMQTTTVGKNAFSEVFIRRKKP